MVQTVAETNTKAAVPAPEEATPTKADGNAQGSGNYPGIATGDKDGNWHKTGPKKWGGKAKEETISSVMAPRDGFKKGKAGYPQTLMRHEHGGGQTCADDVC